MAISTSQTVRACVLLALAIAAAGVLAPGSSAQLAPPSHAAATTTVPRLIAIRAAHHPGVDRLVFEFSGTPPSRQNVRYVNQLIADPSGRPIPIAGRAIIAASFFPATARRGATSVTVPGRLAFALPNVMTVVPAGDFESVLSYGIGLAKRTTFRVFTLTSPSRVVIDIDTQFQTVLKKVYFENQPRFAAGTQPYVTAVLRRVLPGAPATGVMDRLFAGPTRRRICVRPAAPAIARDRLHRTVDHRPGREGQAHGRLLERRLDIHHRRRGLPDAQAVRHCRLRQDLRPGGSHRETEREQRLDPILPRALTRARCKHRRASPVWPAHLGSRPTPCRWPRHRAAHPASA